MQTANPLFNGCLDIALILIPWARGKSMVWDVTVPAESHLSSTSVEQEAAAKPAADNKTTKYQQLKTTYTLFSHCYRDSRLVGSSSHRSGAENRQKHRQHH